MLEASKPHSNSSVSLGFPGLFEPAALPVAHVFSPLTAWDLSNSAPNDLMCPDSRFRGFHVLLDYSGFQITDPQDLSDWTMSTIKEALMANGIRCVHSHSEVFLDERDGSPPGFTAVCLLDESHVSAHCYSAIGMLAIDIFTCGGKPNQTFATAKDIHRAVMNKISCKFLGSSTYRFPYQIGSDAVVHGVE
jgi:S-adenosylmethionine decarboxylase